VNADFQALITATDSGIPGYATVGPTQFTVPVGTNSNNFFQFTVDCPSGKKVLSGGYLLNGNAVVAQSSPTFNPTGELYGWEVGVINNLGSPITLCLYAVCALAHS